MWFRLRGDERITHRCASDGCGGQPTWKLEADGVGSYYCSGCREKIDPMLRPPPGELTVECPHCHQHVSETLCAFKEHDYYKDCYHYATRPNRKEDEERLEREAADLWLKENPGMSVFACDAEMKERYRQRVRVNQQLGEKS